jgi:hypothetical protein
LFTLRISFHSCIVYAQELFIKDAPFLKWFMSFYPWYISFENIITTSAPLVKLFRPFSPILFKPTLDQNNTSYNFLFVQCTYGKSCIYFPFFWGKHQFMISPVCDIYALVLIGPCFIGTRMINLEFPMLEIWHRRIACIFCVSRWWLQLYKGLSTHHGWLKLHYIIHNWISCKYPWRCLGNRERSP